MEREKEQDLRAALDAISPAALEYSQWAMVGMALKESGYPLSLWEDWSRRDASRFHPGECARKWESFRGSPSPVTAASIFELAYKSGYVPSGQALAWDAQISDETRLVDPRWVEPCDLQIPDEWNPADQLKRYLQVLFEADEHVAFVTESFLADDRRRPTRGCWDRTAGQLIEALTLCRGDIGAVVGDCDPEVGAWICFNPVDGAGRKDANITAYRYALVECDNMDLGKQQAIIRQLELPCAALVYSGGKSIHAIVKVDAPDYAEYRKRVDYLYAACQKNGLTIDQQNRNPSRLSRMPGIVRGSQRQVLLDTNIGKSCWEDWRDWLESETDELPDTECLADNWQDLPPLAPPLIEGVLRQGHKMLLAGPSKAGKSFALIELAIAIAEGKRWMGCFPCAQGRVLYINLELDRASCLHRFRDVYAAMQLPAKNLASIDIWNLRGAAVPMDKLAPKLIRRASKKGYIAIILDPIYKVITGDENSAEAMSIFCNQFDKVCRELSCAVIYCHHHSKGLQGGKRSADRASGSGVFARDPDAMLDVIELPLTQALTEHLQNKAECAARMAALTAAGRAEEIGPDEALSPAQLRQACQKLPDKAAQAADLAADHARETAKSCTAWRVEGTLREFARFEPLNLFFDYPIHRRDDSGVLADIQPESDVPRWQKGVKANAKAASASRKEDQKRSLEAAFSAVESLGDKPTLYNLAEYLGTSEKTVRRRVQAHGGYWIDGVNVGKK